MVNERIGRGQRPRLIEPYLQTGEEVYDHGLALWEELEKTFSNMGSRGYGQGSLAATDRRLFFLSEKQRKPSSLIYSRIKAHGVRKKMMTAQLWVVLEDMQEATFSGGKGAYASMNEIMSRADAYGSPEMETTSLSDHPDGLTCNGCRFRMTSQWPYCPGCARTIDWPASAKAVQSYNARIEHYQNRRRE
jgi:hypothetical protein